MKRMISIFVIAFAMLLISLLVPRGHEAIAPNIVRSDFGWPIQSLSLYDMQPVQNALGALFTKVSLSDMVVNFGTLISYFLFVLLLLLLRRLNVAPKREDVSMAARREIEGVAAPRRG